VLGHENVRVYEEAYLGWLADERDLEVHTWQHPEILRDSDWIHWWAGERIQRLLLDAPAQVLDVRSEEEYNDGHIRWSIHMAIEDFTDTEPETWAETLGASGISTEREAVVCDEEITPQMTTMFWLLEYLGHPTVSVCADGLEGWTNRGYTLTDEPTEVREPVHSLDVGIHPAEFMLSIQSDRILRVIDAAPIHPVFPRRWIVASTDIPDHMADLNGFSHIPWEQLLNDGRLRSAAETWQIFEDAGVTYFEELVVTASTLEEATVAYLALRLLGAPMVRVYVPGETAL
jgi:thiosulfate/3-mercaptopyruvate sulfurtransferase